MRSCSTLVTGTPATLKRDKVVYVLSTGIIAVLMLGSALQFAFNESQRNAFQHFGLPEWFRIELTAAKILGVPAIVIPQNAGHPPRVCLLRLRADHRLRGHRAHLSSGDSPWFVLPHAAFFLLTLVVSYTLAHKLRRAH